MGIREDVVDMKKQLDEVKQESVALELVRDFKKANKRMFIIIIVALSMWFITISYLVYVLNDIGVDIPLNCAYVLINMLYSDSKNIYGDGTGEDSVKKYIEGVKNWYYDEDSKYKEEEKVYMYGKVIVGIWDC